MLRKPAATNTFGYKTEKKQNPYIGFTSFQHFNGEKLYSDLIVRPENGMTETEKVECYPVSADAEEKGREQGFYPESSVAYIRVLWKEFEPAEGVYNYAFIEKIINEAKAHGQTLTFRLMAHSTRAQDDVPDWLKAKIPCPARPDGARVKDSPTDPLFVTLFCRAVRKLGERFDADPTFDTVDISLPGAWGEGHNLHLYSPESLQEIVDTYLDVFKNTGLMAQLTRDDLIRYAGRITPVGWRGDGLGNPRHVFELYPLRIEKVSENWKTAPVSFESYWWLGEWQRQGWDLDTIIEKTLSWHISSFNGKSMPIPYEWKEKIDGWIRKMGYHFMPIRFSYPEAVAPGDTVSLSLTVENCGVAPIYKRLPLYVRLTGEADSVLLQTETDITRWMPGRSSEELRLALPEKMKPGTYEIELGIGGGVNPSVYFCTDAPMRDHFCCLGRITVQDHT